MAKRFRIVHPHQALRRRTAAVRIQKQFRKYTANKKWFNKKVQRAVLSRDPVQYRLFGAVREPVSQAPAIVEQLSNIKFNNGEANPMYVRTSRKIKPLNYTMRFRIDSQDAPFNQMCVAIIRHKRSDPLADADLAAAGAPITNTPDKPFLQLDDPNGYNTNSTEMTGVSIYAKPSFLLKYFNPKVVDVVKTWTVNVQPPTTMSSGTSLPAPASTISSWKPFVEWSYTHKFKNEIWKFPDARGDQTQNIYPYNNKCYSVVAWSDSVNLTGHPGLSIAARFSFKDLD